MPWRWRLGLKAVDALLDDLGINLPGKQRLVRAARAGYELEFRSGEGLDPQLGDRFRTLRRELEQVMEGTAPGPGLAILAERSRRWSGCIAALIEASAAGLVDQSLEQLAGTHIHMHLNRLLPSAQRAQEFVILDCLDRLYRSRLARSGDHGC